LHVNALVLGFLGGHCDGVAIGPRHHADAQLVGGVRHTGMGRKDSQDDQQMTEKTGRLHAGLRKKWVLGKNVQVVNQPLAASAQREAAGSGLAAGEAREDHSPAT
jgi:hypothetical protein